MMADREGSGPSSGVVDRDGGSIPNVLPPLSSQTMPMMPMASARGHTASTMMVHPHPTPIRAPPPPFHVQSPMATMVHPYSNILQQQQHQQHQQQQLAPSPFTKRNQMSPPMVGVVSGPRIVILHRHNGDFGFTLRHFIVYPPDSVTESSTSTIPGVGILNFVHPMDTVFVKKVHPNTPAHLAGLQEGDRLLAVNGVPVTSIPYSQVVATIQQTPKTLTLQVVPKNFDILQTFFSETAHNPETNQRPQQQPPQVVYAPRIAHPMKQVKQQQQPAAAAARVQEKQESLYSALQEIVTGDAIESSNSSSTGSGKHAIYAEVPKLASQSPVAESTEQQQQQQHQYLSKQYHGQQQQSEQQSEQQCNSSSSSSNSSSTREPAASQYVALGDGDSALMSRLRKSLEQKEEFLRRPVPTAQEADGRSSGSSSRPSVPPKPGPTTGGDLREFYGRPNRLQKSVWPPTTAQPVSNGGPRSLQAYGTPSPSPGSSGSGTAKPFLGLTQPQQPTHAANLSAIRELFFTGGSSKGLEGPAAVPNGGTRLPTDRHSEPLHLTIPSEQLFDDSAAGGGAGGAGGGALPLSAHSLHAVSEKAKLFESGRPLSPEGIDRMDLYKSELSRINTKQVVPNVAVRRREFELKAESTGWCRSTDDQTPSVCSDSDSTHKTSSVAGRVRSLSVESTPSQSELSSASKVMARPTGSPEQPGPAPGTTEPTTERSSTPAVAPPVLVPGVAILRQKPIRSDDSYRNVVCNSTDGLGPPILLRSKQQQQQQPMDEDERKMRRISYLKATASDNLFQMLEGDTGESGTAQLPSTAAAGGGGSQPESTAQSASDNCFLTTTDHQSTTTTTMTTTSVKMQTTSTMTTATGMTSLGSYGTQQPQLKSHGSKSKALAHFRDNPADSSEPVVRAGELHIKVTTIDGKRSVDRSWRQVHAELRGTRLKLTLLRDGKSSAQSPEPAGTIDLTNFHVSEGNYTKRKNVFRLATATSTGSYCPLEQAAVGAAGGFHPHTEVHRTQSTSGLATAAEIALTPMSSSSTVVPDREILVQADSASDMQQWMEALRSVCIGDAPDVDNRRAGEHQTPDTTDQPLRSPQDFLKGLGGQQAEPQRVAALTSVQLPSGGHNSGDDYSPILPTKAPRKYALGTRSPSGQSPVTKSRKTPTNDRSSSPAQVLPSASTTSTPAMPIVPYPYHQQLATYQQQQQQQQHGHASGGSDRENGSPKSKTWKGIVARQFRKMQGQQPTGCQQQQQQQYPHHLQQQQQQHHQQEQQLSQEQQQELLPFVGSDAASINVPLQHCPMSPEHPYVPLVLAKCTGVVESRGLGVVGIYRIPGNTAAIAQLTDTINRGLDETALHDPRWEDVNVVSSLLKSFIRNLPEPLLPNALYGGFIAADKLTGQRRLIELRQLLHRIPRLHYETLKHLLRHLHRVSAHSEVNLMDPRNLAIVFGPSVVRSANESLETAVKDMRHQCQIVEVLINYYQYFFEDGPLPSVDDKPTGGNAGDSPMEVPTTTLLLDNVSKLEPFKDGASSSRDTTAGFVANIVQAANRKIRRTAQRKSTMSSTTPDTLSLDSTTSAESKEQSMRSITRSRYMEMGAPGSVAGSTSASTTARTRTVAPGGSLSEDQPTVTATGAATAATAAAAATGPAGTDIVAGPLAPIPLPRHRNSATGGVGPVVPMEESLLQLHHHHHHHHHYYHSNRHHTSGSQSNEDGASLVLNRSSEDDSNDSAFADNGSMSLKTVTIALDNKLRSLRNSSIDSDRDNALDSEGELSSSCCSATIPVVVDAGNLRHSLHQKYQLGRTQRPLTLGGENIPYADESPERPPVQGGARAAATAGDSNNSNDSNGNSSSSNVNNNTIENNAGSICRTNAAGNESNSKKSAASAGYGRSNNTKSSNNNNQEAATTAVMQRKGTSNVQQRSTDGSNGSSGNSSTNTSCLTLVNEVVVAQGDGGRDDDDDDEKLNPSPPLTGCAVLSSDETDSSTTSNPREKLVPSTATSTTTSGAAAGITVTGAAAPYRIDTEVLKKMNRILTQLERKANNLERKFNLNRSLSLNYKTPKALDGCSSCCCSGHHHDGTVVMAAPQHCYQQLLAGTGATSTGAGPCQHVHVAAPPLPLSLRSRLSLTKDEKTDKNINRRRQIHDIHLTGGALGCVVTNAAATVAVVPGNSSCCSSSSSSSSSSNSSSNSSTTSNSSSSSCCCDNRGAATGGSVITVTPHAMALPATGGGRQRRHPGSRSIRRRHTVGGTHDYLSNKMNAAHQHHHTPGGPDCCPMPRN